MDRRAVIVCICPNPALDVTYEVDRLRRGDTHRVRTRHLHPGGKAANTARVLAQMGEEVVLVAPLDEHATGWFAVAAEESGVTLVSVPVADRTRTTVTVVDATHATLFTEPGPVLTDAEWAGLVSAARRSAVGAGAVVMSGSLPRRPAGRGYADLVAAAGAARVLLDGDGADLADGLRARPAVVAPNAAEARAATGVEADTATLARHLVDGGAGTAVVSSGADGLVAVTPDGTYRARPAERVAGNPTGAGDALNAALALGIANGRPWHDTLADAIATSAAAVAAPTAHRIDLELRLRLAGTAVVEEVTGAAGTHR